MSERNISHQQVSEVLREPDELVQEENAIWLASKFFADRKLVAIFRKLNGIKLVVTVYWFGGIYEDNS